jgi:hypothetical protein
MSSIPTAAALPGSPAGGARAGLAAPAFAAVLLLASLQPVWARAGAPGAAVFALAVAAAVRVPPGRLRAAARALAARHLLWLGGLTLLLAALFAVVYPVADAGVLGGGSDRDEALDLAVRALAAGEHPYRVRTYLDNPITPMPGALLLAAPFVALGGAALQVLFWVPALAVALGRALRDRGAGILLAAAAVALCPEALRDLLGGGDMFVNAVYVTVAVALAMEAAGGRSSRRAAAAAAVLLGVALSSRPNFVLLFPPVLAGLARAGGARGVRVGALAAAAFAAVTAPIYLADPASFSPLHTANKLRQFEQVVPHAGAWVTGATVAAALLLALRPGLRRTDALLLACAAVQAVPVLATTAMAQLPGYRPFSDLGGTGMMLVPMVLLPFWTARAGDPADA